MTNATLTGLRVLVVEDEVLVAMLLEDMLADFGCSVIGPAPTIAEALPLATDAVIDVAVLDLNLGGEPVYPVADVLKTRGVPYVFASGYGAATLADAHRGAPMLQKPYRQADLERVLSGLRR